jgi:hypothetical protein
LEDEMANWLSEENDEEEEQIVQSASNVRRIDCANNSVLNVERYPCLRDQIWSYPPDKQEQVIRAYRKHGPYQFIKDVYPTSGSKKHPRRFQSQWFKSFPWLEYSPTKDAAFCLPCFLFSKKPVGKSGSYAFIVKGFNNWKRVGGKNCSLRIHMGESGSAHQYSVKCYDNLKNRLCHIEPMIDKQTSEEIKANRLRLRTSIDVQFLAFQACPFRGHDESVQRTKVTFLKW